MAILGRLAVDLIANTKKFVSDFGKSTKSVSGFSRTISKAKGELLALGTAFASVQGTRFFADTVSNIAINVRFAQTLGLSTAKLEGYQKAGAKLGASTENINDALLELSKRSAEATTGVGSMFDVLQLMNVDVEKFNRLNLDQKFGFINEKLKAIKDTAKRNFFADEIFGGASDAIGGLLPQIKGLADEFERSGLGTSDIAAQKIVELDTSIKDLTASTKALGRQALIDVSPRVLEAVKGLQIILEETGVIRKQSGEKKDLASVSARTPLTRQAFQLALPQSISERIIRDIGETIAAVISPKAAFQNIGQPVFLNERQRGASTPQEIRDAMGIDDAQKY